MMRVMTVRRKRWRATPRPPPPLFGSVSCQYRASARGGSDDWKFGKVDSSLVAPQPVGLGGMMMSMIPTNLSAVWVV